jgi:hypothetical protein
MKVVCCVQVLTGAAAAAAQAGRQLTLQATRQQCLPAALGREMQIVLHFYFTAAAAGPGLQQPPLKCPKETAARSRHEACMLRAGCPCSCVRGMSTSSHFKLATLAPGYTRPTRTADSGPAGHSGSFRAHSLVPLPAIGFYESQTAD